MRVTVQLRGFQVVLWQLGVQTRSVAWSQEVLVVDYTQRTRTPFRSNRMPKKSIVDAINTQIGREFTAAYLYLSMSNYFVGQNLPGFARWMRLQYHEEAGHALRLYDYLHEVGATPELGSIRKPAKSWANPKAVMKESLRQEQAVTKAINDLYALALKEKDYPTQLHLQWFINEQVEEEKTLGDIIAQMELAGDSGHSLLLIDRELGARASATSSDHPGV